MNCTTEGLGSTYIYGLYCPVKGVMFYVGRSVDPVKRLRQHIGEVKSFAMKMKFPHLYSGEVHCWYYDPRRCWLAWLVQQNLEPELVVLQVVDRELKSANAAERSWIGRLLVEGHPLTNGQGVPSWAGGENKEALSEAIERGREMFGDED